ncbi:salicylate synthase [Frankia sp. KB5]|nr:salicylate synthase [Frankia sp. KB5]
MAQLIVPEVEIRIAPGRLDVRGTDEATVARVLAVVDRLPADGPEGVGVGGVGGAADVERHQTGPLDVVTPGAEAYQQAVAAAVERIQAGRLAKVVLSRRVPVPFEVDLAATCLRGRRANSPARTFLVDLPGMRSVGFSPETVAEVGADGEVSSQPLAGTRPLGRGAEQDAAARAELWCDAKEVFEHAVSVRAVADDLAGICVPDSVTVRRFMDVEARGSVQHLASRVAGRLRPGVTNWEALAVLSPAITASGIPRGVACQTVAELEPTERGLYAGAALQVGHDGFLDAALALRCLHTHGGQTWLQAGAGVVADSRPSREYAETCEKFASIAPHLVPAPAPTHRRK